MTPAQAIQQIRQALEFYANGDNYLEPWVETPVPGGVQVRTIPGGKSPIEREHWGMKAKDALTALAGMPDALVENLEAARTRCKGYNHLSYDKTVAIIRQHYGSGAVERISITEPLTPEKCSEVFAGWRRPPIIPPAPACSEISLVDPRPIIRKHIEHHPGADEISERIAEALRPYLSTREPSGDKTIAYNLPPLPEGATGWDVYSEQASSCRQAFEKWRTQNGRTSGFLGREMYEQNDYADGYTQTAWNAWQAAWQHEPVSDNGPFNSHADARLTKAGGMSFGVWSYILTLENKAHDSPTGETTAEGWRDYYENNHTPHEAIEEDFNYAN